MFGRRVRVLARDPEKRMVRVGEPDSPGWWFSEKDYRIALLPGYAEAPVERCPLVQPKPAPTGREP